MYAMINMHTITIDVTNSAGLGHNALISIGEEDRSFNITFRNFNQIGFSTEGVK